MAEQNLFCLCGRCSRKLRSAAARRVGMGSTCCRKETGKTITQLLKELDEQEAAAAAEQQEPDPACGLGREAVLHRQDPLKEQEVSYAVQQESHQPP